MTPQLFINYKLKSVAHLPWRMLTYKALNTFIDDLFAFVIKMPTLYRLGVFRDGMSYLIFSCVGDDVMFHVHKDVKLHLVLIPWEPSRRKY